MRSRRPWTSAAALTVVACGAAGCASPAQPTDRSEARAQCVVGDPEGEVIVLPGSLTAETGSVLGRPSPDGPVNLEVVEEAVVAFAGRAEVQGVITDYPPAPNADLADSLARWADRRPLDGLRLAPDDGQQGVLVALRLRDPSRSGHLDGVTVTSSVDGEAAARTYVQPLLVEPHGQLCTVTDVDATREWVDD